MRRTALASSDSAAPPPNPSVYADPPVLPLPVLPLPLPGGWPFVLPPLDFFPPPESTVASAQCACLASPAVAVKQRHNACTSYSPPASESAFASAALMVIRAAAPPASESHPPSISDSSTRVPAFRASVSAVRTGCTSAGISRSCHSEASAGRKGATTLLLLLKPCPASLRGLFAFFLLGLEEPVSSSAVDVKLSPCATESSLFVVYCRTAALANPSRSLTPATALVAASMSRLRPPLAPAATEPTVESSATSTATATAAMTALSAAACRACISSVSCSSALSSAPVD